MSGDGEIVVVSASDSVSSVASKMPEIQADHVGVDKESNESRSNTESSKKQNCYEETKTVSDLGNKGEHHISDGGDGEKAADESAGRRDDLRTQVVGEKNWPANSNSESECVSSPVKKEAEAHASDDGGEKSATDDFVEPDEELVNKIVKQIEFYFSDVNISKDAYLMRHARRNKFGYVNLGIVSSFKRVRSLTKDRRVVVYSLRKSEELVMNETESKVRRRRPLPEYDETAPFKTVVAVNLGLKDPSVETVTHMFSGCEGIALVRVFHPKHNIPHDVKKFVNGHREFGVSTVALIEFEMPEQAHKACKTMTNTEDWRSGRRVTMLCNKRPPWTKKETSEKVSSDDGSGGGGGGEGQILRKKGALRHRGKGGDLAAYEKNTSGTSSGSDGEAQTGVPKNQRRHHHHHHHYNQGGGSNNKSPQQDSAASKNGYQQAWAKPWTKSKGGKKDPIPQEEPSPWVQRRQREALENSGSDGTAGASVGVGVSGGDGAAATLRASKLPSMVGVIRQPKGPDGTTGFCGGLGRGKPRCHTIA